MCCCYDANLTVRRSRAFLFTLQLLPALLLLLLLPQNPIVDYHYLFLIIVLKIFGSKL